MYLRLTINNSAAQHSQCTLSVYMPVQTINTVMCLLFNEHTGEREVDLRADSSSVRKKQDWEHSSLEERKCFIEEIITVAAVPSSTVMYVPENKNATGHICVCWTTFYKKHVYCVMHSALCLSLHTSSSLAPFGREWPRADTTTIFSCPFLHLYIYCSF